MAQRILVGFSTVQGQTAKVAEHVARTLRAGGAEVDVRDVGEIPRVSLADYDGVVLGASIHVNRHQRRMVEFVRSHREALAGRPNAFFSVSLTATSASAEHRRQAEAYVEAFTKETGWKPARVALFAGALPFTRYGFIVRFVMKRISRARLGPLDTSRDHEFTDWESVTRFAEEFLRTLGASGTQPVGKAG
ncbi:flavodoxin domain-containing protein [Hyalangium gracile]|uniref:flavodoxin domain-containing protein n=1 Tax=Hyalangium gracile TaxID=394092 RepID=UPI001CCCB7AA|nr:flavodoxin domain-containing protein [Hyalangium gracile]